MARLTHAQADGGIPRGEWHTGKKLSQPLKRVGLQMRKQGVHMGAIMGDGTVDSAAHTAHLAAVLGSLCICMSVQCKQSMQTVAGLYAAPLSAEPVDRGVSS